MRWSRTVYVNITDSQISVERPDLVTELPIVTEVSLVHSANASPPILVTELPIVREVSPEHCLNALYPMLVTELGIVSEVSPEHSRNLYIVVYQIDAPIKVEK